MNPLILKRFASLVLLLCLGAGCASPAAPAVTPARVDPTQAAPTNPTQAVPTNPAAAPDLPAEAELNLILGRPGDHSISASLYSKIDLQVSLQYGSAPGSYTAQSDWLELKALEPQTVELSGLSPDTLYYYRVITRDGQRGAEHRFQTRRPPGSSFRFTIDADPHNRDPRFNGELYATTLRNALASQPDFHIDLGDTFMTEKLKAQSYAQAESSFTDMLPYFGILNADAPLFLVNGNHEGELGWLLNGRDKDLPAWSSQLRQQYYPGPVAGDFYTGSSTRDPGLNGARDGYYAWTWGDALFIVLDPFWYTTEKPRPDDLNNNWGWTLGKEQYDWLKNTLETSPATFKLVFTHHLVGGIKDARGGVEAAPYFEWGGQNADGSDGFADNRPGWEMPIHALLVANGVQAVFHGHDHVFVRQELDGIVYQEVPQPSQAEYGNTRIAADYGYLEGDILGSSGHLLVTVTPTQVTVDYVRAYLAKDENSSRRNGQVDFSYTLMP